MLEESYRAWSIPQQAAPGVKTCATCFLPPIQPGAHGHCTSATTLPTSPGPPLCRFDSLVSAAMLSQSAQRWGCMITDADQTSCCGGMCFSHALAGKAGCCNQHCTMWRKERQARKPLIETLQQMRPLSTPQWLAGGMELAMPCSCSPVFLECRAVSSIHAAAAPKGSDVSNATSASEVSSMPA